MKVSGFDWDSGNHNKCGKHGVAVGEIEELFSDSPFVTVDSKHTGKEDRLIAVGRTAKGRALFVAFTLRIKDGKQFIRPVSARYMHAKEMRNYEEKEASAEA